MAFSYSRWARTPQCTVGPERLALCSLPFFASTFRDFFFLFLLFFCFSFQTSFHLVFIFLLKHGAPQTCFIGLSIFSIFCHGEKHLNLSLHLFITATFTHFSTHFSSPLLSICDCVFSTTFVSARILLLTFSTDTLLRVVLFYSEGNFHKRVIIEVLDHSWACTAGVVESLL